MLGQLAARSETFTENLVSVEQMGNLIDLVQRGTITGKQHVYFTHRGVDKCVLGSSGKSLLRYMLDHPSDAIPAKLAKEQSLIALADGDASLRTWCEEAIQSLPEEAEVVRRGNLRVLNKLVGKVMKASRGRADAVAIRTMLLELLVSAAKS